MIDHTGVTVTNFEKSKTFYKSALAPLGYKMLMEFHASVTGTTDVAGFGEPPKPDFWISQNQSSEKVRHAHVAFRATSHEQVNQFYAEAFAAGGVDNGKPGPRPHYHDKYYGAFVLDPDGYNIEAVCHE